MSSTLKNYINQLDFISKIKNENLRKKVLSEFGNDELIYKSLREIVENTIRKNIPINIKNKKKLFKYRKVLRGFTKKRVNKKTKKQLVSQSGGFLPILIPLVISLLSNLKR